MIQPILSVLLMTGLPVFGEGKATEKPVTQKEEIDATNESAAPATSAGILQIFEPTKPKPVGVVPEGWTLKVLADHQAQSTPILLENGKQAEILSTPFVLEPDLAAGRVEVREPGYDPERGIAGSRTLAGLLADEVEQAKATDELLAETLAGLEAVLGGFDEKAER